jgi:hypothetical protein
MILRLVLMVTVAMTASAGERFQMPDLIRYNVPGAIDPDPAWVSERAAIDEQGALRFDLFSEGTQFSLRHLLERNPGDSCVTSRGLPFTHYSADPTLDRLVEKARIIIGGRVVATSQGFYGGSPATLLAVKVDARLKEQWSLTRGQIVYIVFRTATIRTKSGMLCSTTFPLQVSVPAPGDRVLAFALAPPNDELTAILNIHPDLHLLVQHRGEPRLVKNTLAQTVGSEEQLDRVIERVRGRVRADRTR